MVNYAIIVDGETVNYGMDTYYEVITRLKEHVSNREITTKLIKAIDAIAGEKKGFVKKITYIEIWIERKGTGKKKRKRIFQVYIESDAYYVSANHIARLEKLVPKFWWFYENGVWGFVFKWPLKRRR